MLGISLREWIWIRFLRSRSPSSPELPRREVSKSSPPLLAIAPVPESWEVAEDLSLFNLMFFKRRRVKRKKIYFYFQMFTSKLPSQRCSRDWRIYTTVILGFFRLVAFGITGSLLSALVIFIQIVTKSNNVIKCKKYIYFSDKRYFGGIPSTQGRCFSASNWGNRCWDAY